MTVFNILLTSERIEQYTRSLSYTKKFPFGRIQLNPQWHKFTPLSPAKGQLSYQHWRSENISHIRHFKCWFRLVPVSQSSPLNPGGQKHRYPLEVNPDWQVALFWHWELLSQAFWRRKKVTKERWRDWIKEETLFALWISLGSIIISFLRFFVYL